VSAAGWGEHGGRQSGGVVPPAVSDGGVGGDRGSGHLPWLSEGTVVLVRKMMVSPCWESHLSPCYVLTGHTAVSMHYKLAAMVSHSSS